MSGTGNGIRGREMGLGNGDLGAGRSEASKDIAESPARSERPNKDNCQLTTDNRCFFELKVCGQCSEFKVQSSEFRVQSSEFRVQSSESVSVSESSVCVKKKTPQ